MVLFPSTPPIPFPKNTAGTSFQVLKFLKVLGNFLRCLTALAIVTIFVFLRFVFGILIKKLSLVALQVLN